MTALRAYRSLLLATTALVSSTFGGAASAASPARTATVEVARVVVNYADLDLDTERGVATLQRRIEAAARQVCGTVDPRELRRRQIARECATTAIARAVEDVGSAQLAKLNAARNRTLRG